MKQPLDLPVIPLARQSLELTKGGNWTPAWIDKDHVPRGMLYRFLEQQAIEQDCIGLVDERFNQPADSKAGILLLDYMAGAGKFE